MKLDLDQLRELIRLLDESNLTEIEVEHDDDRIRVRRDPASVVGAVASPSVGASSMTQSGGAPSDRRRQQLRDVAFRRHVLPRSPLQRADAFVQEGDSIAPGQVAVHRRGHEAHERNRIRGFGDHRREVLVENGKPVEYGDRLFRIETS